MAQTNERFSTYERPRRRAPFRDWRYTGTLRNHQAHQAAKEPSHERFRIHPRRRFPFAPRYAIAKVAVFSLYASDQARTGGDACLLLDVGCTFSRADAAQFRRFIAEDLGCTVDVVFRSALTAEDFARAETEARVVYENPDVTIASTPDTRAQAAPPAAPKPPVR